MNSIGVGACACGASCGRFHRARDELGEGTVLETSEEGQWVTDVLML